MAEEFSRDMEIEKRNLCTTFFTKFAQSHFDGKEMIEIREILQKKMEKTC